MRRSIVAIAVVAMGIASPALADALILTIQDQVEAPQAEPAPAQPPASAPAPRQDPAPVEPQALPPAPAREQAQRPEQESAPAGVASRYNFQRVDGGFVRLDSNSGQIAYCSARTVGWACQAVPEDRAALEKEIARLQDQVAGLRDTVAGLQKEIAALREPPPPPRPPAELAPRPDKDGGLTMPSDEEMARARAAVENAWRRLMDMITEFKNDMMRRAQSDRTTL